MSSVAGRCVMVTGAAGGIGRALVEALLAAGAGRVIAAGRTLPGDPRLIEAKVDITDADSVRQLADRFAPEVDVLINNAGANGNAALFADGERDAAERDMRVNYFGLLNMLCGFAPAMQARGSGLIVNVLSFAAIAPQPAMSGYAASKAAAHNLTQSARVALAPHGVRVMGVYPRAVETRMTAHLDIPKLAPQALATEMVAAMQAEVDELFPGTAAQAYAQWLASRRMQ